MSPAPPISDEAVLELLKARPATVEQIRRHFRVESVKGRVRRLLATKRVMQVIVRTSQYRAGLGIYCVDGATPDQIEAVAAEHGASNYKFSQWGTFTGKKGVA